MLEITVALFYHFNHWPKHCKHSSKLLLDGCLGVCLFVVHWLYYPQGEKKSGLFIQVAVTISMILGLENCTNGSIVLGYMPHKYW